METTGNITTVDMAHFDASKKLKVLLTGAKGMLGSDVAEIFRSAGHEVKAYNRKELDITDKKMCLRAAEDFQPEVIINCAAYTKVDECEKNLETAMSINKTGAENIAKAAEICGAYLIHISTDYVFDGTASKPYTENDLTCPVNVYGLSKLGGEDAVKGTCTRYSIIRTSWLFGAKGQNFIKTILKLASERNELKVVNDQCGCPTYTRDLAKALLFFAHRQPLGLFHCTNNGSCTWYELAKEALSFSSKDPDMVKPVSSSAFPRPAKRPAYSVLDNSKFEKMAGFRLRSWKEALRDFCTTSSSAHGH